LATSLPAGVRQRVAVPTDGMDVWRTATVYQARQGPAPAHVWLARLWDHRRVADREGGSGSEL